MKDIPDKSPDSSENKGPRRPIGDWSNAIDEAIQEAMRDGAFDNLPGRGKPLNLSQDPYTQDTEMAYKLLKDNDYTLPWIADRLETLAQIEALRAEIRRDWTHYRNEYGRARSDDQRAAIDHAWRSTHAALAVKVADLNGRIAAVNLTLPNARLEILKLNLERELGGIRDE